MTEQHRPTMLKFFPAIDNPAKVSTAMCATIFEELDAALTLMDTIRGEFNPLQRQIVGRFIAMCTVFGRNMLAADGNPDALRAVFGLSTVGEPVDHPGPQASGLALIDDVCTGVCRDLERIGVTTQEGLLEGVTNVMSGIRSSQEPGTPESDVLDAMTSSVHELAHQVAALFEAQPYTLRRYQLAYQGNIKAINSDVDTQPHLTVEEFMQTVKPPQRRPTLRERLEPYVPQLARLREQGYSYAQCAQFLRENGINAYPAAISNVLLEVRSRGQDRAA